MGHLFSRLKRKHRRMESLGMEESVELQPMVLEDSDLLQLPVEILLEITLHLERPHLLSWFLVHRLIASLTRSELFWRLRCLQEAPVFYNLACHNFSNPQSPVFTWKQRYQLLGMHPQRLSTIEACGEDGVEEVDATGLVHTNIDAWSNILATKPFLTTIDDETIVSYLKVEPKGSATQSGIDYFECTLLKNTLHIDRATAIGVAGPSTERYKSFIGWRRDTVAYHSDDGTIRSVDVTRHPTFGTGDIVGCGLDWKRSEVFFTKNGSIVGVHFKNLAQQTWYPAVGTMMPGDSVRVNFGVNQPFRYNLKNHEANREAFETTRTRERRA